MKVRERDMKENGNSLESRWTGLGEGAEGAGVCTTKHVDEEKFGRSQQVDDRHSHGW